jgi:hypothetical protein
VQREPSNMSCSWTLCLALAVLLTAGAATAEDWEYKSMSWVPGPNSTSVRSPLDSPQPTSLTWSIVPEGVATAGNPSRITDDFLDLGVTGLTTSSQYQAVLASAMDQWASVADITNLGYVSETGAVEIGGVAHYTDRGPASGVGHVRFMAFDQEALNGATAYAQATSIPEPGTSVDNNYNHARAGDVRFRSDTSLWGATLGETYFHNIAMHEVGHVLGFGHNFISDSVMSSPYNEPNLGTGDIAGAVAIYGPPPADMLAGDYNEDDMVDAADYTLWRDNTGAPAGTLSNDTAGGRIGHAQYIQWQVNFGNSLAGSSVAVPEPTAAALVMLAALGLTALGLSGPLAGRRK